jgi:hypothetical protein
MSEVVAPTKDRAQALREVVAMWALAFGAIVVFKLFSSQAKTVATIAFLYLPLGWIDRHGEHAEDYGLTWKGWQAGLVELGKMLLLVFPLFIGGFWAFVWVLPHLPKEWVQLFTPYGGALPEVAFRLPQPELPGSLTWVLAQVGQPEKGALGHGIGLVLLVLDQFLVVALSEEFFYRGFMQRRLRAVWPDGPKVLGATLGRAFWLTQLLFALGHLAEFRPWRLAVFFPSILFGIMRERTGTVFSGACFHALCNLTIFTLEASAFGR